MGSVELSHTLRADKERGRCASYVLVLHKGSAWNARFMWQRQKGRKRERIRNKRGVELYATRAINNARLNSRTMLNIERALFIERESG